MNYGNIYKSTEFIKKIVPKKGNDFLHDVIDFMMALDNFQEENDSFTFTIHAADGIWGYYNGVKKFFIKPTQKHIMFHVFSENELSQAIASQSELFCEQSVVDYAHLVSKSYSPELEWLKEFIAKNYCIPIETSSESTGHHPRHIRGYIRQAVLEEFQKHGRICNGVSGSIKSHKVEESIPLEYDHILPYSKGGASSFQNVQILCINCNRSKSASAR